MKKRKIILIIVLVSIIVLIGGSAFYLVPSSPVSETELSQAEIDTYKFEKKNGYFHFESNKKTDRVGVVIYQGARFEPLNYSRIANDLQQRGYDVFISDMPLNWAFFNSNLAGDIMKDNPDITSWFIGGHSLGGAMASSYVQKNMVDSIKGIFFLAAYPVSDFSQTDIPMLYIFSEFDGLVDTADINKAKDYLSSSKSNKVETIIGGNHSQFGNVKTQSGDNPAKISGKQQQEEVADVLDEWMMSLYLTL